MEDKAADVFKLMRQINIWR